MRLDEYNIADAVCNIAVEKYFAVLHDNIRSHIRDIIADVWHGRCSWQEYLVLGKDVNGRNVFLLFSSDLRVQVGYIGAAW